jgi:3D (Asp-Asp-Asp) domain-containing protein
VWFVTLVVTAYCLIGTTATRTHTRPGTVAVDPSLIPLHSKLSIPGYGRGRALDTGGAIKGHRADVWFASCTRARQWGVKRIVIRVSRR